MILAIHWLLAMSSVRDKSTTFDEIAHLAAGISVLKTGNYGAMPETPHLVHLWAAAPIVLAEFNFPEPDHPDWWRSDQWPLGRRLFYECGNDPQSILIRGRAMIALLSTALGLVVWLWSRRLFGQVGGIISLILYAFSPTILAHGRLITTDLAAGLFFLIAVTALWRVLHRVSPASVALSALAVSGLLLTKMSGLIILPIAGVLVLVRLISNRPTELVWSRTRQIRPRRTQLGVWLVTGLVHVVICVLLIRTAYGFQYAVIKEADPDGASGPSRVMFKWDEQLRGLGKTGTVISWLRDQRVVPESYLMGLAFTLRRAQVRPAFLNGQSSVRGWWYFFPYCFAVKTPLPLLGILLVAVLVALRPLARSRNGDKTSQRGWQSLVDGVYRTAPLWALFVVYWFFAITSSLNIGHRHIVPVYPVLFIFAGGASAWLRPVHPAKRVVVPVLVVLFIGSSLLTCPHYLAYFNMLVGGPANGYKHLVDSSLDWGQDLPGLRRWLDRHGPQRSGVAPAAGTLALYLSYFGASRPDAYGIDAIALPIDERAPAQSLRRLTGGIYCISATNLQQVYSLRECRWTRAFEAVYLELRSRLPGASPRSRPGAGTQPQPAHLNKAETELFGKLRFARLCAALRRREPDDNVGHTILIYRLSDRDVQRALRDEPPESIPDDVNRLHRFANECFANQCLASAVIAYRFLLDRRPMSADPAMITAAANLGITLITLKRDAQAVAVLRDALRYDPRHRKMNEALAWLLATSQSSRLRDGAEAMRHAKVAVDVAGGSDPMVLDTLAAAYAESGQFDQACHHVELALKIAKQRGMRDAARQLAVRLKFYRAGRPWREP